MLSDPNGGVCELSCDGESFASNVAMCSDGSWILATCVPTGTLEVQVRDATDGTAIVGVEVYIEGLFDPASETCADALFCQVTNSDGIVNLTSIPASAHRVSLVTSGFATISHPIELAPEQHLSIELDAVPTGYFDEDMVIKLDWDQLLDLDVVVTVPAGEQNGARVCIFGTSDDNAHSGNLDSAPFAELESDAQGRGDDRTEIVRISLNPNGTGPRYDGTYSVVINTLRIHDAASVLTAEPTVRLIRSGENGAALVNMFEPSSSSAGHITGWHVFDLHGDGSVTTVGSTEVRTEETDPTAMPCVDESIAYSL